MASARMKIIETGNGLAPSDLEVHSDALDDEASVERAVRSLAILWHIATGEDAEQ